MKQSRALQQRSDEELVTAFAEAANKLGDAVNHWDSGAMETDILFAIEKILRDRGEKTRLKLVPLLDSQNRFVQYYSTQHLMVFYPHRCRRIIEETARQRDAIAGDAGMHLYALDNGISKPD